MNADATYRHWMEDGIEAVRASGVRGATPWHAHMRLVVGRIDRGMYKIVLRGGEIAVPAGVGFALPPGLAHRTLAADPTDYRILCIPAGWAADRVATAVIAGEAWCELFERGFAAVVTGRPEGIAEMLTAALPIAHGEATGRRMPGNVSRLAGEIAAVPENRRNLAQMADRIGMSPFHLQRLFVGATGLSPRQARLIARLHRAREMLVAGQPASETAVACGFSDQSHLSREFRRWTGLPPGRYLAQLHRARR